MTPNELIAIRRKLGLSQAEIGAMLGFSKDHISKMERGEKQITRVTVLAVNYLVIKHG